jgi:hypothetical protein
MSKDVVAKIDSTLYQRVRHYSDVTGVPAARVIRDTVTRWLDVNGHILPCVEEIR